MSRDGSNTGTARGKAFRDELAWKGVMQVIYQMRDSWGVVQHAMPLAMMMCVDPMFQVVSGDSGSTSCGSRSVAAYESLSASVR